MGLRKRAGCVWTSTQTNVMCYSTRRRKSTANQCLLFHGQALDSCGNKVLVRDNADQQEMGTEAKNNAY